MNNSSFQESSTVVQFRRLEITIIAFLKKYAFTKMTIPHSINARTPMIIME
jgi:hypothetical protein